MDDLALLLTAGSTAELVEAVRGTECLRAMLHLARPKRVGRDSHLLRSSDPSLLVPSIMWPEVRVRLVPSYKHLGGILSWTGSLAPELKVRCAQAWQAFRKHHPQHSLPLRGKNWPERFGTSGSAAAPCMSVPHVSGYLRGGVAQRQAQRKSFEDFCRARRPRGLQRLPLWGTMTTPHRDQRKNQDCIQPGVGLEDLPSGVGDLCKIADF